MGDSATPGLFEPGRCYANYLDVRFSISEADLRFGQTGEGRDDVPKVVGWVVTTPVHLVAFARTLDRAIARYGERFGPMPADDAGGTD